MMKKIVIFIFILLSQLSFSLRVERIKDANLGVISESKSFSAGKAAEVWVVGKPGRRVRMEILEKLTLSNGKAKANFSKIHLRDEEIILDERGRGKFRIGMNVKVEGSGNVAGNIPAKIKYVD